MRTILNQQPDVVANSSGFPLQLGVIDTIRNSSKWRVVVAEYPWRSEVTRSEGFIDTVASNPDEMCTFIIECKRVRQAAWVFLIPQIPPLSKSQVTVWDSHRSDGKWNSMFWAPWQLFDAMPESEYCAIPGQEQGRRNLLENAGSILVESVEAFAQQEMGMVERRGENNFFRVYVPILVTTARLFASSFDPATIRLVDGALPDDASFEERPYIMFRKSFSVVRGYSPANDIRQLLKDSERTILVVNAESLPMFLNQFELR
jgi:hypothetical protein